MPSPPWNPRAREQVKNIQREAGDVWCHPLPGTPGLVNRLKTFKGRLGMSDALPLPGTSGLVSRLKTFTKLLKRSYFFLSGAEGWGRAPTSVVTASSGEGSSRRGHGTPCCSAPSALWSWGTSAKGEHAFHCRHLQLLTGLHLSTVTPTPATHTAHLHQHHTPTQQHTNMHTHTLATPSLPLTHHHPCCQLTCR